MVVFGQGSTGAANDLAKANELAIKMVREFGLSSALGPVGYPGGGSVFLGDDGTALSSRPFAENTQATIDIEVQKLVGDAEKRAVAVLQDHRDVLDRLVQSLLNKETVDGSEVYALTGQAGPRGGPERTIAPARAAAQGPARQTVP
jgi:cell division protease FtsH